MSTQTQQNAAGEEPAVTNKKPSRVAKVFKVSGVLLLLFILVVLIINALLTLFKDDYYTTFGNYRLFAIVTDSMEPEIPSGSMIVCTKPINQSEITTGTVITFKYKNGDETILLTHRVVSVATDADGAALYTTRGDNAGGNDSGTRKFEDVVGIYTGNKCGFFGSLFGFFQSALGVSMLMFAMFVIVVAWIVLWYVNRTEIQRSLNRAALKKSAETLSNVNLRYDNIHEITAVMDVLSMVTDTPRNHSEEKVITERLNQFIHADDIKLPQTPETAAVLDSLPAPDTPGSLAAALSAGATLRQAEDGQTLVLTTMSGGKNIMLTPVQTADGIILCQQGVRVRADIAPNIEEVGITSMPASPEFFEGQPLEKNVNYPELPQPTPSLGPDELLAKTPAKPEQEAISALASPTPSGQAKPVAITGAKLDRTQALPEHVTPSDNKQAASNQAAMGDESDKTRRAYAQYREMSARLELKQAEQLRSLLHSVTPLSYDEQKRVAEYKAVNAKPKKPRKTQSPEQRTAAKARAQARKAEREAFLSELSPEDRELYLTEEKLAKSRQAAIRRLKRMAADRKLLEKLD